MAPNLNHSLNPDKALIFRITHRANVPWLLAHGLYCRTAHQQDPNFVTIGNRDLIASRNDRAIDGPHGGTLSDYIPFYFTPFSPMLLNVVTGRGVPKQPKEDIVVLVSSLPKVQQHKIPFVFTDRHASLVEARFSNQLENLAEFVPWDLLRARDFSGNPEVPDKMVRYMAEALVYHYMPSSALLGLGTYTDNVRSDIEAQAASLGVQLTVLTRPNWFF